MTGSSRSDQSNLGISDKKDAEFEVLHISKAVSSAFKYFDFVVNSLQRSSADWVVVVVKNWLQVVFDHVGHFVQAVIFYRSSLSEPGFNKTLGFLF